jgi:hypothetical protein
MESAVSGSEHRGELVRLLESTGSRWQPEGTTMADVLHGGSGRRTGSGRGDEESNEQLG